MKTAKNTEGFLSDIPESRLKLPAELPKAMPKSATQWLIMLEIEKDPIITCRLINTFRRKGLEIATMTITALPPNSYSAIAVVESQTANIEHVFNFLRRMEDVRRVVCCARIFTTVSEEKRERHESSPATQQS
jgi:acetolactate synthase regulatory subunit